jgi:IS5 family transposase
MGSAQKELFGLSKRPQISVDPSHELVQLAEELDWTALEESAEGIRKQKLKNAAGRPPKLRPLIGSIVLMGVRRATYREAEDLIRHYGPARYLCGLTETDWTPDFTTINDFTLLMGEEGVRRFNEEVVKHAVWKGLADPTLLVADTTAQEASIPWPNEMGLMGSFVGAIAASAKVTARAFKGLGDWIDKTTKAAVKEVRAYHLFAKTKADRNAGVTKLADVVEKVQRRLAKVFGEAKGKCLKKKTKRALARMQKLSNTMSTLLPQVRHWIKTGHVAKGKIINLKIPELYAIVRGKIGKKVEFGLKWGIRRIGGGFLMATMGRTLADVDDSRYVLTAVNEHIELFGAPPKKYGYDRAGYSQNNIVHLQEAGVRHVGVIPQGKAKWSVSARIKKRLLRERACIEGGIGTIKMPLYGFNFPAGRSVATMGACGQRALLGFNVNKLLRELRREAVAV